jgi:hypothetical protein
MRALSPLSLGESRRNGLDSSTREDPFARRGRGRSTHARKGTKHGIPCAAQWQRKESEGLIVPVMPSNVGGGKGPWFGMRLNEMRGRGLACA